MLNAGRRVAILGGARLPFARSNTAYVDASNEEMLRAALQAIVDRFDLGGERLGEVVAGAVLRHSRDLNLTREAVLGTTLDRATPAYDVAQACGTGLQAAVLLAGKIALGQVEVGIAGGVDTASDAPIAVNERLRRILLEAGRARTAGGRLRTLARIRPDMLLRPVLPRNAEPRTGLSMGEHCERMARNWRIGRAEQDALALRSHRNLARAYERGFTDDLVVPFRGLTRDNNLRLDTSADRLAALKPVFGRDGTLTAGNSTPLTDGAAVVLLASEAWAHARNLPVLAFLSGAETAAVDFVDGHEGLLMAPAYAVPRLLDRLGLGLGDFDYYEFHEAFAAQVLCTLAAWRDPSFSRDRLGRSGPLGRSIRRGSTWWGARWPRGIRSRRRGDGSWRRRPSCWPRRGRGGHLSRSVRRRGRVSRRF